MKYDKLLLLLWILYVYLFYTTLVSYSSMCINLKREINYDVNKAPFKVTLFSSVIT